MVQRRGVRMVSNFQYRQRQSNFNKCVTHSRNILISPHCNPSDPNCADVLTTAYHTLLCSTLRTWSPHDTLTADAFLAFLQSVLDGLPSSSTLSTNSSNVAPFGEIVVDMVWSIDAELDEILADTKVALANVEQGSESGMNLPSSCGA
jgi:THO complex subunit 2